MASEPYVSIIIPNYNHARFLDARINSVLNQSYHNFEVIILDDCSTDDSRDIIEKYRSHPKIAHIEYNNSNSGSTFHQWNKGIRLAKGNWIWFAESDDLADENFLVKMTAAANDNIGIVYCQSYSIDEKNKVWEDCLEWTNDLSIDLWRNDFVMNGKKAIQNYLVIKNIIPNASACLLNTNAIKEFYPINHNLKFCGDWMLWSQLLLKYDLAYLATPLNYFRFHNTSTRFFKTKEKFIERIEEDCKVIQFIYTSISINTGQINRSCKNIESFIYEYYKNNRKFPFSLRSFKKVVIKYDLPVNLSLKNLYQYYLTLLCKKVKSFL